MYRLRRSPTHKPRRRSGGIAELTRDETATPRLGPSKQRLDHASEREIGHGRKKTAGVDRARAVDEHEADEHDVGLGVDSVGARWLRSSPQQQASTKP